MRLLIFFLCIPFISKTQQTINADQFFTLGLDGYRDIEKTEMEKVNFPWIDQYEFRTETNDFELDKQEYLIRLTPSTPKIRNAQKALYEEMVNAPDFEGQEIYCDLLLSLHDDWLSLFIINENRKILDELVVILNDKKTIFEKMVGTYEFDPEKLMKLHTEKSDIEISRNKLELEWDYLLNKHNIQNQEIDFGNFISVESISKFLAENILSNYKSELVDLEAEYKNQLLTKEIELESSEKKRLVDFLQLKYTGPHSDPYQERFSVGMGFQLSNSGSKKLKMQELKIEQEELKRKSERNKQEKLTKLNSLENILQSDLQAFFHFQRTLEQERAQLKELSNKLSQDEGTSPLFLLDIEERYLNMKTKSLNKTEDILRDYLKYLQQSGKMCQNEIVNYLDQ